MTEPEIEEIEHTADWAIRVQAPNPSTLFEQAALGMSNLIGSANPQTEEVVRPITLQAADLESLLVGWLEELLFILETEDLMLTRSNVQVLSDTQLLATVEMRPVNERWKEIKAVTYHDLEIKPTSKGFEVVIVFDV